MPNPFNLEGEWKPSPIFPEHYWVSSNGDVFSIRSNRKIKAHKDTSGYYLYFLFVNHQRRTISAHRLVAMAFIPNPLNKPAVDHIDTNKVNNDVSNLRWVTHKENAHNSLTYERLAANGRKKIPKMNAARALTRRKRTIVQWADGTETMFDSAKEAANATGISYRVFIEGLKKRGVTHGYRVRYANECDKAHT